ncbi:hypothetical protein OG873_02130 [Streptomyces violaceus]|uniref:hypothetical protein n=1 Tax=Streptomyces violaceus TaxID=1936 RepID=UPI002E2E07C5|nr:hypothetical protein [Streptomyces violaceus]
MAPTEKASTRDGLLDAAAEIFYREGDSVGVEVLCRSALLARQLMLVFDGAGVRAGAGIETLDGLTTATALLDASGMR